MLFADVIALLAVDAPRQSRLAVAARSCHFPAAIGRGEDV